MAKPGPKPRQSGQPLWKQPRSLAIAASSIVGLVTLGFGVRQLLVSDGPTGGGDTLERVVESYLEKDRKESNAERHQDVEKRIQRLVAFMSAPGYGQLPSPLKDAVRNRHRELRDYQEYEKELNEIADPQTARTEDELKKIHASLTGLRVPPEYLTEWSGTAAGDRHHERLTDTDALAKAVRGTIQDYRAMARDGRQVLDQSAAPRLPQRAKEVLDRARALPDPKKNQGDPLPGSQRLTFATVFFFAGVGDAIQDWAKVRETLEGLAGLRKP